MMRAALIISIYNQIDNLNFIYDSLHIYFRRILIHMTSFESWWWSHKKPSYLATDNYNFLEMIAYFMHERCSISWRHFVVKSLKMHVNNVILNVAYLYIFAFVICYPDVLSHFLLIVLLIFWYMMSDKF